MDNLPFHDLVSSWFARHFDSATPAQLQSWQAIKQGHNVLIAAPTGSGKTLAAFLAGIDRLVKLAVKQQLENRTYIIYVSPLKALSNDIRRNLEQPLSQITESQGLAQPIRAEVRTGDTPAKDRQRMVKEPPHILVTTPESLYILLTAERSRQALCQVETVIVDEIHAVANSKRGAHLSLTLERLDRLVEASIGAKPQRVGVSATQRPIETVASMLVGSAQEFPVIVDSGHKRDLDLAIELTDDELAAVASTEQLGRVYDRMAELISEHQTTLLFVNTRRMVERVSHHLAERLGDEQVVAHHGSMSKKLRFVAEHKLKTGQVKCAVATASLELGIDIGDVDLVIQLGSPRSISVLLQRIGRAGHGIGRTPKGRLFALTRDQLIECTALMRAIRRGKLDAVLPQHQPLDILAQQIVACSACEDLQEDELFDLCRQSFHFRHLQRQTFDKVLDVLANGMSSRRGRVGARIFRDKLDGKIRGRKGARLISITCGGAIPDNANYPVILQPENTRIGDLDEDFAIESLPGDIVLLGNTSWKIRRVAEGKVFVEDAQGAPPNVPFWFGEAPARTSELSHEVGELRQWFADRLECGESLVAISSALVSGVGLKASVAEQVCSYLAAGYNSLGAMPTTNRIVVERFFDDGGGMQLVVHAPLGGRINRAWGLALRKRFCRSFNFELQAAATDDGIVISLGEPHSFPLEDVANFLHPSQAKDVLIQAMLDSAFFEARWRWNATRSLAVLRRFSGKKVPPHLLRMRCDDLLSVVFPMAQACLENVVGDIEIPDHPIVKQTVDDCLHEAMDVDGLIDVLTGIQSGDIEFVGQDTVEPSFFSHELINANPYAFLDDTPLEERRTRAVSLRRGLGDFSQSALKLDPAIAIDIENTFNRPPRDDLELCDMLAREILAPARTDPAIAKLFSDLVDKGRATTVVADDKQYWVHAESLPYVVQLLPDSQLTPKLGKLPFDVPEKSKEDIVRNIVQGYLSTRAPRTLDELTEVLPLSETDLTIALAALEADGAVFRGQHTKPHMQWCERSVLAKLHRSTLKTLRKSVEPVAPAAVMRFLFHWHNVLPGMQQSGGDGLYNAIAQLQGYESAAVTWESELLPARVKDYRAGLLDDLCIGGDVTWCRLAGKSGVNPTKAAPITLMTREDALWLRGACGTSAPEDELSEPAKQILEIMRDSGASFIVDIASQAVKSPEELEPYLWELVSAGIVTADGFAALRSMIASKSSKHKTPKSRRAWRKRRPMRPRKQTAVTGRWSLMPPISPGDGNVEKVAEQLLDRYGVIFRDLLARETSLPPWRAMVEHFYRLEARGLIRSGHFVSGLVGPQFAVPEALSLLRRFRNEPKVSTTITINATDPLNLVGILLPGPRITATAQNQVVYRDGVPVGVIESGKIRELGSQTMKDVEQVAQAALFA